MGDFGEWKAKYLGYVDKALGCIPYGRAMIWKGFFLDPIPTLNKDDVGILQRMKDMAVVSAIGSLVEAVIYMPPLIIWALISMGGAMALIPLFLAMIVANLVLAPVMGFIYSLLELLVAKALGGTGSMRTNFNASALPGLGLWAILLPLTIAFIPIGWLSMIPFVSICTLVVTLPVSMLIFGLGLYSLYLKYLAMKEVHSLTSGRAAMVVLLPIMILMGLLVLIFIAVYAIVIASAMGAIGTAGGAGAGTVPSLG